MVIRTNTFARYATMYMNINNNKLRKDLERLSSGYKINRAADDAAGLAISEKLRSIIAGLKQGHQNELDSIGFIQVGDGAMSEIHDMLLRMKTLSAQAANGTLSDSDRKLIDTEIQELKDEIDNIGDNTTYDEVHVFDNKSARLYIDGDIEDPVSIYNSTNDHHTPNDTSDDTLDFGGILIPGSDYNRRVRWDEINQTVKKTQGSQTSQTGQTTQTSQAGQTTQTSQAGQTTQTNQAGQTTQTSQGTTVMGYRDAKTGEWKFNPGEYSWTDPDTGNAYRFLVKPGAKVPEVSRIYKIHADTNGITIDGNNVDWSSVKNDDGISLDTMNTIERGLYSFEYKGATISIYSPQKITTGVAGFADLINSTQKSDTGVNSTGSTTATLMTDYSGTVSQSAVSADIHTRVSMTSTLAHMIHEKSLNLYYTADKDGIKLWNKDNTGTSAKLDEKSWQDLKIVKVSTDPTDPSKNKDGWDWGNNAAASKGEPQLLYYSKIKL